MPIARFRMPDGRIARFEVPNGTSPEQAQAMIEKIVAEGMPEAAPKQQEQSKLQRFGIGMADPIHGGAQLLTKLLPQSVVDAGNMANNWLADKTGLVGRLPEGGVDQMVREREAAYTAARGPDAGIDWMRLLGNVASPTNVALAAGMPSRIASLGGRVATGAAGGAAASSLAPVEDGDFFEEKVKQMAAGGVAGGVFPLATAAAGRVISPRASVNPDVKALRSQGVRPTVGQTLGGTANRLEEKAVSLPFVGDSIRNARNRAEVDLRRAVAQKALSPINEAVPPNTDGRELVAYVGQKLSDRYNAILPRVTVQADATFNTEISNLRHMVLTGAIDPKVAKTFKGILQGDLLSKFRGRNALTGETIKQIESDLGQQIARFGRSQDPDMVLMADALREAQHQLRELVARANPQFGRELKAVNEGWSNFVRLQKAASFIGAEGGEFGPAQLQSAVKALDPSKRKGTFAAGIAKMQSDLSDPAKNVLGNKVPNSGSADRWAVPSALAAAFTQPWLLAAPVAGAAAYTPLGQAILRGAVASRPAQANAIAELLNRTSPVLAPASGLFGVEAIK